MVSSWSRIGLRLSVSVRVIIFLQQRRGNRFQAMVLWWKRGMNSNAAQSEILCQLHWQMHSKVDYDSKVCIECPKPLNGLGGV
jgi:hypothetical protein